MTESTVKHREEAREGPERVWITWDDAYPWDTPENGGEEYVSVDVLSSRDGLLKDACETEDRCRTLLKHYDKSDSLGVVPLDEVITDALSSRDTEIREVLEGLRTGECWCDRRDRLHTPDCLAASVLWEKVKGDV